MPSAMLRENRLNGAPDIAALAGLIGDDARAAILLALLEKGASLSASKLAAQARIGLPAASKHLARLVGGGLLVCEPHGRQRLYSLRDDQVAQLLELLSILAPMRATRTLSESSKLAALRAGRTCYDHLAGRLGVAVFDALVRSGALAPDEHLTMQPSRKVRSGLGAVTHGPRAAEIFARLGLAADSTPCTATACLDWTETRPHLSGPLGARLCERFLEEGWVLPRPQSRAVTLTCAGRAALEAVLEIDLDDQPAP